MIPTLQGPSGSSIAGVPPQNPVAHRGQAPAQVDRQQAQPVGQEMWSCLQTRMDPRWAQPGPPDQIQLNVHPTRSPRTIPSPSSYKFK